MKERGCLAEGPLPQALGGEAEGSQEHPACLEREAEAQLRISDPIHQGKPKSSFFNAKSPNS